MPTTTSLMAPKTPGTACFSCLLGWWLACSLLVLGPIKAIMHRTVCARHVSVPFVHILFNITLVGYTETAKVMHSIHIRASLVDWSLLRGLRIGSAVCQWIFDRTFRSASMKDSPHETVARYTATMSVPACVCP
ncbi:hypothetical protein H9L39_01514 [Fusarium oxysporum f. sp. albedinis]|nr:hypothetical protein H9L39_01514 [Fusarium oxysporum f. sp. albedinis]